MKSLQEEPIGVAPRPFRRTRLPLLILLALASGLVLGGMIFLVIGGKINLPFLSIPSVTTMVLSKYPGETLTPLRAALVTEKTQTDNPAASPSAIGASSPAGSQMPAGPIGQNWIQVQSFPAPGNAPTGIVRVGDTLWVTVPCDNSIYRLDLEGNFISEIEMPEPGCGPGEVGLAWDGTSLWGTWWEDVIQINPDTGLTISKFSADLDGRSIAWDGSSLWVADREGNLSVYDLNGQRQRHLAVPIFGVLSGITWANGELWVLDEFGTLTRFDQDLLMIDSFSLSAECGISSFHQQMALGLFWDGASLWVADAVNDRIYECAPSN